MTLVDEIDKKSKAKMDPVNLSMQSKMNLLILRLQEKLQIMSKNVRGKIIRKLTLEINEYFKKFEKEGLYAIILINYYFQILVYDI